jgi:hypothetical protein
MWQCGVMQLSISMANRNVQWHQWHAISGVTWRKPNVSYFSYGWLAGEIANQPCHG